MKKLKRGKNMRLGAGWRLISPWGREFRGKLVHVLRRNGKVALFTVQ